MLSLANVGVGLAKGRAVRASGRVGGGLEVGAAAVVRFSRLQDMH